MKRPVVIAAIVVALIVGVALGSVLRQPKDRIVTRTVTEAEVPQPCIDALRSYASFAVAVYDELDALETRLARDVSLADTEEFIAQQTHLAATISALNDALPARGNSGDCARASQGR